MAMRVSHGSLLQLSRHMASDTGGRTGEYYRDLIVNGYPDIDSGGIEPVFRDTLQAETAFGAAVRQVVTIARAHPALAVGVGVVVVGLGVVVAWKKFQRGR